MIWFILTVTPIKIHATAREWYQKAAQLGRSFSMAAEKGNSDAMYVYAEVLKRQKHENLALKWYEKAAEAGNVKGQSLSCPRFGIRRWDRIELKNLAAFPIETIIDDLHRKISFKFGLVKG